MSGVRQEGLYLCVQEMHQQGHAIAEICDILDLNRSSYYKWTHRTKSIREIENEAFPKLTEKEYKSILHFHTQYLTALREGIQKL